MYKRMREDCIVIRSAMLRAWAARHLPRTRKQLSALPRTAQAVHRSDCEAFGMVKTTGTQPRLARNVNLALRFLLELLALAALAYWGAHTGSGTAARTALAIGAPLCMAVAWGLFAAPRPAVQLAEPLRFAIGLAILCLTALALAAADHPALAVVFAAIIVINAALLLVWPQLRGDTIFQHGDTEFLV
jgi:Protein of unknown function (DUF2568)